MWGGYADEEYAAAIPSWLGVRSHPMILDPVRFRPDPARIVLGISIGTRQVAT